MIPTSSLLQNLPGRDCNKDFKPEKYQTKPLKQKMTKIFPGPECMKHNRTKAFVVKIIVKK